MQQRNFLIHLALVKTFVPCFGKLSSKRIILFSMKELILGEFELQQQNLQLEKSNICEIEFRFDIIFLQLNKLRFIQEFIHLLIALKLERCLLC